VDNTTIQSLLDRADDELEELTGRTFGLTTGSTEYHTVGEVKEVFFTKNFPIVTLSAVARNTAGADTDAPVWQTLSEGLGEDYIANTEDLTLGRIKFIDKKPYEGVDRLKIVYNYGYASTPELVKELAILLATRKMVNSTVYKSIIKGYDNFTPIRLEEIENRIKELIRVLGKQSIESI
jgi:hypothetical protein